MKVKKFTAATSRDALRKVREALGPDAVILSNRPVDGQVEILALDNDDVASLAAPAADSEMAQPAPQLRALMVTPGRALANINGQILAAGEWFGDYQLTKVDERGVTLKKRGVTSVLLLDESRK